MASQMFNYLLLLRRVNNGEMSLEQFRIEFCGFQEDGSDFETNVFDILNTVFLDCDEYEPDSEMFLALQKDWSDFVIDESEFRRRLEKAMLSLENCRQAKKAGESE